jgi:AraC-like DNA-binding protein
MSIKDPMEMTAFKASENSQTERAILFFAPHIGQHPAPGRYSIDRVTSWSELHKRLPRVRPNTVLILEPYAQTTNAPPEFWEALSGFPSLAVIAAVPPYAPQLELRRMVLAGVGEFLNMRLSYPPALLERLADNAFARPLKRRIEAGLSSFLSGDARILIRAAAEAAASAGDAEMLGRSFGVTPTTVTKWCEALHLPPPRRLQLWLRLLLTAQLMDDAGRSISAAARAAGYATDRSFRRALRSVSGEAPRELRKHGAFDSLLAAFNADVHQFRADRKPRSATSPARVLVPLSAGENRVEALSTAAAKH